MILLHSTIFCSEEPCNLYRHIPTQIMNLDGGAWTTNDKIVVIGSGFEVIDTTNNTPIIYEIIQSAKKSEVATNSAYYAVTIERKVVCMNTAKDTIEWIHTYPTKISRNIAITFTSHNKNDVTCLIKTKTNSELQSLPSEQTIYDFKSINYSGPLSWHTAQNKILMHADKSHTLGTRTFDNRVTCTVDLDSHSYEEQDTDVDGDAILEARYNLLGDRIVIHHGNLIQQKNPCNDKDWRELAMNKALYAACGYQTAIPKTKTSYSAFECYNDDIMIFLSQDNILQIFNYVSEEMLNEIDLSHLTQSEQTFSGKRLLISPDRDKLLIIFSDGCYIIPMASLLVSLKNK